MLTGFNASTATTRNYFFGGGGSVTQCQYMYDFDAAFQNANAQEVEFTPPRSKMRWKKCAKRVGNGPS